MKVYNYLLFFCSLVVASCNQQAYDDPIDIEIIPGAYISFNVGVESRGGIVSTDYLHDHFSVFGYKYNSDWETADVMAKPDLFYNRKVTWDNNTYEYGEPEKWESNKFYSFFAYYPHNSELSANTITLSSQEYEGIPYLTYHMPTGNDISQLNDVMTANIYDTNNQLSNTVNLIFEHRLAAFDVQAQNHNKPDTHTNDDIYVEIKSLSMQFDNLNNQAILLMDASKNEDTYTRTTNFTPKYTLISTDTSPIRIPPTSLETGNIPTPITTHPNNTGKTLIFIPQKGVTVNDVTTYMNGKLSLTYQFVGSDGKILNNIDGASVPYNNDKVLSKTNIPFTIGKDVLAGRRYNFQINFSRSSITIGVVESEEWTKDQNIDIEFE